jgi:pimeloyl-ACP methyl ester carboxylesterase
MKSITLVAPLIFGAAILTVSLGLAADSQKKDVDIQTPDGTSLKGSYYSPGKPGPAMLLLHQCNMDRHAWDGLAKDLVDSGFHVLTIDFRGFGQSAGGPRDKWPGDVDAAYAFLISQKGVDKSHVAAGGASCGVTQASNVAVRHHEIRALVLLSGSASAEAKAYFAATPSLPIFGAASVGDAGANKGIEEALAPSKNPHSVGLHLEGTEHGVPMFAKHPDLEPMIVQWLKTQLSED